MKSIIMCEWDGCDEDKLFFGTSEEYRYCLVHVKARMEMMR